MKTRIKDAAGKEICLGDNVFDRPVNPTVRGIIEEINGEIFLRWIENERIVFSRPLHYNFGKIYLV